MSAPQTVIWTARVCGLAHTQTSSGTQVGKAYECTATLSARSITSRHLNLPPVRGNRQCGYDQGSIAARRSTFVCR